MLLNNYFHQKTNKYLNHPNVKIIKFEDYNINNEIGDFRVFINETI